MQYSITGNDLLVRSQPRVYVFAFFSRAYDYPSILCTVPHSLRV